MTTCRNCEKGLNSDDSSCQECGHVVFADEKLEAAVREELGKPEGPLTRAVIRELTSLDASGTAIEHLSGLGSAVNLTELSLNSNQITDVSPLASLTNLTRLRLYGNQISDVGPLCQGRSESVPVGRSKTVPLNAAR